MKFFFKLDKNFFKFCDGFLPSIPWLNIIIEKQREKGNTKLLLWPAPYPEEIKDDRKSRMQADVEPQVQEGEVSRLKMKISSLKAKLAYVNIQLLLAVTFGVIRWIVALILCYMVYSLLDSRGKMRFTKRDWCSIPLNLNSIHEEPQMEEQMEDLNSIHEEPQLEEQIEVCDFSNTCDD
ncbi:hypothetical protein PIB30_042661 [Stylosanthes scabra]|uniref:Uncharacterized protein n=1 Tax=Stylosanthes scabra TaxID=79078 RepID=A0ABU6SG50_9FABA|nr:hypothetical protein [Stylosanthes scabra]